MTGQNPEQIARDSFLASDYLTDTTGGAILSPPPTKARSQVVIDTAWMNPQEFKRALRRLKLSYSTLSRYLDVDVRTVKRWASGESPVPTPITILLRIWVTHPDTQVWTQADLKEK